MERRLAAILAADVVGYSRLMGVDEAATLAALNAHRKELLDAKIAEHKGRIVKLTGDGMLVEFSSVVNAVACAANIQSKMIERNDDVPADRRIEFRIGVNVGDVIVEDGDIHGDGVNVAARLESIAEPGGVAISGAARDHLGNRLDLAFADWGERMLKNIERPVRVYSVILGAARQRNALLSPAVRTADEKPSIAVLPFTNMSGDPEQEYFSDGITEDIITDLSKISALHVSSRYSAFAFKGKAMKVEQIARELSVDFILEGSVRKAGGRVRVTAQLIDAGSGGHSWAERYDRNLTDIFRIQDELTSAIVEQLKLRLLPQEQRAISASLTGSVEAYDYYLKGRQAFHKPTKPHLELARRMFEKAIELDPSFARAHAGIADVDCYLFFNNDMNIPLEPVLERTEKALELDPLLAEAHASRGLALSFLSRDAEAVAAFEKAIVLDPNLFEAVWFYGRYRYLRREIAEAIPLLERAAALRPTDSRPAGFLRELHVTAGNRTEMEKWARESLRRAEAEVALNPENPVPATFAAGALATLGDSARAREWASRALTVAPDDVTTRYNVACLHAQLGDIDDAFDILEPMTASLLATSPTNLQHALGFLEKDGALDPIRSHPRYAKLLAMFK